RPLQVAKNTPIAALVPVQNPQAGGELSLRDLEAAAMAPSFSPPMWRSSPRLGNGLISLASYGDSSPVYDQAPSDEIYRLEAQAQFSVAQFMHQEALRMHQLGDHRGAAEAIANLVKKYPNYPRIFEALALRIGCLFQIGQ